MQKVDFEMEQQQADQELGRLLKELVVNPIDEQLKKWISDELCRFNDGLKEELKRSLSGLAKARDLDDCLETLDEKLGDIERKQKQQTTSQQLRSALDAMANSLEKGQLVCTESLEAALNQQLQIQNQQLQEGHALLQKLLTQLGERLDSLTCAEQQALAEMKRQAADQQGQLQRTHADLAGMLGKLQALPVALTDLQGLAIGGFQQMQGLVQQQQVVLDGQQQEILRLHRSLRGFAWSGLALGVLNCTGLVLLALHTPAIRALLGLAG